MQWLQSCDLQCLRDELQRKRVSSATILYPTTLAHHLHSVPQNLTGGPREKDKIKPRSDDFPSGFRSSALCFNFLGADAFAGR